MGAVITITVTVVLLTSWKQGQNAEACLPWSEAEQSLCELWNSKVTREQEKIQPQISRDAFPALQGKPPSLSTTHPQLDGPEGGVLWVPGSAPPLSWVT